MPLITDNSRHELELKKNENNINQQIHPWQRAGTYIFKESGQYREIKKIVAGLEQHEKTGNKVWQILLAGGNAAFRN
ncbi:MAG: hypothetical protein ACD_39C01434G0002 [uncultured bacterium]|nr:MAG: hypothetical protein ACD_39C01434G0002 [uncultured bacterium]